jgi:hypothetical protein
MSPRPRTFFASVAAALILIAPALATNAQASESGLTLRIASLSFAKVINPSDGQPHSEVLVRVAVANTGSQPVTDEVSLTIGRSLFTRSQLAKVIESRTANGLATTATHAAVTNLAPGASTTLELRLGTDELWGQSAQGVFPIGVKAGKSTASDVIATGWFGNSTSLAPTKVTFAVPITSELYPDADEDSQALVLSESQRLQTIASVGFTSASFVVDPYVVALLNSSQDSKVRQTATTIQQLNSTPSIYAQTNLTRLNAGNQVRAIKRAIELTTTSGPFLYLPKSEKADLSPFGSPIDSQIIPVINNTFVAGDKLETLDASASTPTGRALVFDQAISDCLVMKSAFDASWCLSSQLSMVTAESPNVSRSILLVAPTKWNPTSSMLQTINEALSDNNAFSLQPLSRLLTSPTITTVSASSTAKAFDSSLRKVERDVLKAQTSAHNVFGQDAKISDLSSVAAALYSQNWKSNSAAKHFGRTYLQSTHELLNDIHLEGSKHITIPGTKADLPITVFNNTKFTAKVIVNVDGAGSSRLTAQPSELVTVEPGSRVTVQIPIQLNSSSSVLARVQLSDSTGKTFGDTLAIEIASTAYQQFARSLVWLALVALVLLVGNNVWRRTRKSHDV